MQCPSGAIAQSDLVEKQPRWAGGRCHFRKCRHDRPTHSGAKSRHRGGVRFRQVLVALIEHGPHWGAPGLPDPSPWVPSGGSGLCALRGARNLGIFSEPKTPLD